MRIRPVMPSEYQELGRITLAAYRSIDGHKPSAAYSEKLRDVAFRDRDAEVLVAVGEDGALLGGVTYVADPAAELAEFDDPDEACFRMLAVDPGRRGEGTGAALVEACIERARAGRKRALTLYTTPAMTAAHRLYERFGFRRDPSRDMIVESDVTLRSYVLDL